MSRRLFFNAYRHIHQSIYLSNSLRLKNYAHVGRISCGQPRFFYSCSINCTNNHTIIETVGPIEDGIEWFDDQDGNIRSTIEYDASDPIIETLLASNTVQDVINVLHNNELSLTKSHLVQSVLVLWHLQNMFVKVQTQMNNINDTTEAEYMVRLHQESAFIRLLGKIEQHSHNFTIDELTCTLLYLSKMNVPIRSNVAQKLISEIGLKFKNDPTSATLAALSRTTVAYKNVSDLSSQMVLLSLVPHIEAKFSNIQTVEDLKLLTICLLHSNQVVSKDMLLRYKGLVEQFLDESKFSSEDLKPIVKILTFLSFSFWAHGNIELIRKLCKILKGNLHKLDAKDILAIHKTIQTHQEPATLAEEVFLIAKRYLASEVRSDKDFNVGMLSAVAPMSTYKEKLDLEKLLYRELQCEYFISTMLNMFQILRSLKTSNRQLCHMFWSKTTSALHINSMEREPQKLLRVAHRYMYFNNNMGGSYRNYSFEKQIITWILDELDHGLSKVIPSRLARSASFVIAYCKEPHIVTSVIQQLLSVKDQLSKNDCVSLSRGVEIMLELTKKKAIHPDVMEKLVELDTCMNETAWRQINGNDLNILDINAILRTFHNRRASPDSLLFHTIIDKLKDCEYELNSRLVRDVTYCLSGQGYLLPELMDKMAAYIVKNPDDVMCDTAERVLSSAYYMGYEPQNGGEFFSVCTRLLIRDKERVSCLSVLQTCLALSYFHAFPPELVSYVFAVDFLERIDSELATCYSKATYPVKVRYTLMELNRAVCLDQPELDVPWFHTKYCQEISSLDPGISSAFHENVKEHLTGLLGSSSLFQTAVYSPYGYKINFLVLLDGLTKPLLRSQAEEAKDKVAVILHSDGQFTIGDRRLKGQQQLRQRHLEMIGYRVVPIPQYVWNAMYLTEPHAKKMFLHDQIWPER